MQVKEIMTREVELIAPTASLTEAAQKMSQLEIGPLPVCDGERLVGMLTDRDITVRATAQGRDPQTTAVRDVMTQEVVYCFEDQEVELAAQMMEMRQIRRVPVLDHHKRLVGIVSLGDLAVSSTEQLAGATLHEVSEPAQPKR